MNVKFIINDNSYVFGATDYFAGVLLLNRFKWEIGALVRLGEMITILVLAGLSDSLFTLHHKWRWCSSASRLISSCSGLEPFTNKLVSSANNLGSLSNALCRSLMCITKNIGPSDDPWGISTLIGFRLDWFWFIDTNGRLLSNEWLTDKTHANNGNQV